MPGDDRHENRTSGRDLPGQVGKKADRRIRARRSRNRSVWFGMGMFGLVGWTVAIYTVIGIALGTWLDRRWPGGYSWTMTLLVIGLAAGLVSAWYWIKKESQSGDDPGGDDDH